MIAATQTQNGRRYPFYRCGAVRQDCDHRAAISAEVIERIVETEVRASVADFRGRASGDDGVAAASARCDAAQGRLDRAIVAFTELGEEPATAATLGKLRDDRVKGANPQTTLSIRGGESVTGSRELAEAIGHEFRSAVDLRAAAAYTEQEVSELGKQGMAFPKPGGGYAFPVKTRQDLVNAINLLPQTNLDKQAVRAWLIKRAKALNAPRLIPTTWAADGSLKRSATAHLTVEERITRARCNADLTVMQVRARTGPVS